MDITVNMDNEQILEALYEDGDIIYEIIRDKQFEEYFKEATIIYLWSKDLSLNIIPESGENNWHIKYEFEKIMDIFNELHWDEDTPVQIDQFIIGLGRIIEKLKIARNKCLKKME